jgi:hypothetical protein
VSAPPFRSLIEAFLEDRFRIIEGELTFDSGNYFGVIVSGSCPTGAGHYEIFRDSAAVELLNEMLTWRGRL